MIAKIPADKRSKEQMITRCSPPSTYVPHCPRKQRTRQKAGSIRFMAPRVGFEPTTLRLTAECSAVELPRNNGALRAVNHYIEFIRTRKGPIARRSCAIGPLQHGRSDKRLSNLAWPSLLKKIAQCHLDRPHIRIAQNRAIVGASSNTPSRASLESGLQP